MVDVTRRALAREIWSAGRVTVVVIASKMFSASVSFEEEVVKIESEEPSREKRECVYSSKRERDCHLLMRFSSALEVVIVKRRGLESVGVGGVGGRLFVVDSVIIC